MKMVPSVEVMLFLHSSSATLCSNIQSIDETNPFRLFVRRHAYTACLRHPEPCQKLSKTIMLRSPEIVTVKVHDLVPHRYKVVHELLLGVLTSVNFC